MTAYCANNGHPARARDSENGSMEPRGIHKPKLLIIDDEPQIRRLLVDLLDASYDCCDASSAEEALNALSNQTFDLVLSDIDMGRMSGLELVPHVHALSPDTVV